ncbi:alkaline phosphatase [Sphingomonas hengshuiensis]|uniref:Alkaline phosphatase n=1 Tax=Sphingomonas hengshuiensis TaxID=1609977 RepID=A0A7U5BEG7_9SPHN|nr:alkaline phosphatase [Sphingomonas hengshuiensis]AJP70760.1 alkaline phosphatase [Sphingomonas hengshuiensis]
MISRIALVALLALSAQPALAQDSAPDLARGARGDIREPGGARRLAGDMRATYRTLSAEGEVRNVILLIGDGMGDSEITLARNYAEGAGGYFKGIDALPFTGQYTHYSLDRDTGKPNYVTDSAASATAWASGVKSYNGAIGVDLRGTPQATLIERARAAGLGTGNVSTAEIQDATPGAQIAHVAFRSCYAPAVTSKTCPKEALENGGAGSITEQMLNTRADLVLGGGAASFAETATAGTYKGKTLFEQAQARGYRVVRNAAELDAATRADDKQPLIGLFADGNMPVRWIGPKASLHGNIDQPAITCQPNGARGATIPTLAAMTRKAIALLKDKPKGFFLQVEGASIDKQDHAANPCGQIGETVDLDEAVQVALEFARADGHTLVIVTADHAHTSQIVGNGTRAPGLSAALNTREGGVMTVTYGTAEEGSQAHTGTQLRIAAYGPHAVNVSGLLDQTDLHYIIRDALKLD